MAERKPGRKKKLPLKRQKFVEALVGKARGNKTEAARIAGYQVPRQEGHRLLTFADVSAEVQARLDRMTEAMGSDEIIARLSGMARADMTPFYEIVETPEKLTKQEEDELHAKRAAALEKGEKFEEPPVRMVKRAYLDVGRALENGMGWLFKSHADTEHGSKIEIHDAKDALKELAKIRGLVKQNVAPPPPVNFNVTLALQDMPEEALEALALAMAKHQAIPTEATPKA